MIIKIISIIAGFVFLLFLLFSLLIHQDKKTRQFKLRKIIFSLAKYKNIDSLQKAKSSIEKYRALYPDDEEIEELYDIVLTSIIDLKIKTNNVNSKETGKR